MQLITFAVTFNQIFALDLKRLFRSLESSNAVLSKPIQILQIKYTTFSFLEPQKQY